MKHQNRKINLIRHPEDGCVIPTMDAYISENLETNLKLYVCYTADDLTTLTNIVDALVTMGYFITNEYPSYDTDRENHLHVNLATLDLTVVHGAPSNFVKYHRTYHVHQGSKKTVLKHLRGLMYDELQLLATKMN